MPEGNYLGKTYFPFFTFQSPRVLKALSARPVHGDALFAHQSILLFVCQNEKNLTDFYPNSKNAYCKNLNSAEKYKEESENYLIFDVHY